MPKKEDPIIRFHRKYKVDIETDCWIWTGSLNNAKYPMFKSYNDKLVTAHRFSYEYFVGPLDPKLEICHKCNCKECVNPNHLRQDTKSSNQIDRSYAMNHYLQKLSPNQVEEIKLALKNPYWGIGRDLANKYGVHSSHISMIKHNKTWSHLSI